MKKPYLLSVLLCFLCISDLQSQEKEIPMVGFSGFEGYLRNSSDTLYIINFWATWCGPCRRELPAFEQIHKTYSGEKVKVLLVSLDFPSQRETGLKTFLKNNQITALVLLLNEPDANAWIDKIDPSWTGSLPATLMLKGEGRQFFEKELSYTDITNAMYSLTNM